MTRMAPSFRGWRGSCTPSSKRLRLLRVLDLMLATEGDTKVGAGQSQERGLCRQTENDHHTVHSASRTITELGPLTALFSSVATPRAPWDLRMTVSPFCVSAETRKSAAAKLPMPRILRRDRRAAPPRCPSHHPLLSKRSRVYRRNRDRI